MISTAVLIGAITGAVVVGAIGVAITYNVAEEKGAEGWELFGWTLLGVLAGSIVGAIGYGIGYAAGGTYANGLVAKSVTNGVNSFFSQSNKVHKLLKITRHNSSKYTPKTAAKLMKKTLAKGTFEAYKTVNSMVLASTNSQVTYVMINGTIMISDMWIRMGG